MFQYQSVVVLCLIITSACTFPLDEDISGGKRFSDDLQCYEGDEFGIFQDVCPAPRSFYRREIMNEPVRRMKTPEEYEDEVSISFEDEENNPQFDSMFSKYSKKSADVCDKNCDTDFYEKKHNKKSFNKNNYQFEKYLKSYPDFNSNMEFNAQIVEESSESESKSAEDYNLQKLRISEDIIEHPNVEEVHVDKVVNENGKETKNSDENNTSEIEENTATEVNENTTIKEEENTTAKEEENTTTTFTKDNQSTTEEFIKDKTNTPKEILTTEIHIESTQS